MSLNPVGLNLLTQLKSLPGQLLLLGMIQLLIALALSQFSLNAEQILQGWLLVVTGLTGWESYLRQADSQPGQTALPTRPEKMVPTLEQVKLELAAAQQALRRANQAEYLFLSRISHELRTPLHVILGFTQLLREESMRTTEQWHFVDTIRRNGEQLLKTINSLPEAFKIENTAGGALGLNSESGFGSDSAQHADVADINGNSFNLVFKQCNLAPEALSVMPLDWRSALNLSARECNEQAVFRLLDQIPFEHQQLAIALKKLTVNFHFEEISALSHPD